MKTNSIKYFLWLALVLPAVTTVKAQTKTGQTAYDTDYGSSYDVVHNDGGRRVERIQIWFQDKKYKAELVEDKMTEFYADGVKIPTEDWNKYTDAINAVNDQLKANRIQAAKNQEQARLNAIQAQKNQEQAVRNQEQEKRNELQVKKNQEQAERNEQQAKLNELQEQKNQEQAVRNQEQARVNELQVKRDQEQTERNEQQVKLNQLQQEKNQEQAVRNQEQARLNEIQAKKNEEQAKRNEQMIKDIKADLVNDKIIPNERALKEMILNSHEMIVNGIKQPDEIFKKYAAKFHRDSTLQGEFHYSDEGTIPGN